MEKARKFMNILVPALIIALLILLNGLFVAAEFAIVASRRSRIEAAAGPDNPAAKRIMHTLSDTSRQDYYIVIAQLGITLATLGLGMYAKPTLADGLKHFLGDTFGLSSAATYTLAAALAIIIVTYFHVVVGELIPKALALQTPERTALGVSSPMRVASLLFYPLAALLFGLSNGLLKLLRIPISNPHGKLYPSSELKLLVAESYQSGLLDDDKQELIQNIFDFGERRAHQVMTPRPRVEALELNSSYDEVMALTRRARHSRFPVFEGTIDKVVGILHIKDVIRQEGNFRLRSLVRPVPHVPENMLAEEVLARLRRAVHMAIVIDEYGGTAGIVTLEDLLEEVVGEVQDEFDNEEADVVALSEDELLVRGGVMLEDFAEDYDLALTSEEADTLAGLVVEELGRVPHEGDHVSLAGATFTVKKTEGLAVTQLLVNLPETGEEVQATQDDESVGHS